jgi:hypothetical protein
MDTRGLLAALSLGAAIIATRVLAGPAIDPQQPASLPTISVTRPTCTGGDSAGSRQRQQQPADAGFPVKGASASAQACRG